MLPFNTKLKNTPKPRNQIVFKIYSLKNNNPKHRMEKIRPKNHCMGKTKWVFIAVVREEV